ncbi:hypothetical protein CYMTET_23852 [Cymbomonas tetramitiformis]|uniref:Uncharacterized protein n=1 Tax=Cymbomonas tetramitiformis TaxID=36881 RepID=A0AAE0L0P6_9CHLO|nr:hypothetical protein CYMTET_23852 [Cymbomonas tetramitiformis]
MASRGAKFHYTAADRLTEAKHFLHQWRFGGMHNYCNHPRSLKKSARQAILLPRRLSNKIWMVYPGW